MTALWEKDAAFLGVARHHDAVKDTDFQEVLIERKASENRALKYLFFELERL